MDKNISKPFINKATALAKAQNYCAYQERSHWEVKTMLFELGVYASNVDEIVCELIADNFLNEERFALAYVSGKFNIKNWGKIKIKQGLRLKNVSEPLIKKALNSIGEAEYLEKIKSVILKKRQMISEKEPRKAKYKLYQYALGRGFESDLISYILNNSELNNL